MVSLDRFIVKEKKTEKEEPAPPQPKKTSPPPKKSEKVQEEEVRETKIETETEAEGELEIEAEGEGEAEGEAEVETEPAEEEIVERTIFEAETPQNTGTLYLLSVTYSGTKNRALLKLYDHERGKIVFWYDNTGHRPYLLTDLPLQDLLNDRRVASHPGFDGNLSTQVEKYDLLYDRRVRMTKVVAKDPLSIGGRGNSLREILENSWEDNIRYHECYTYDLGLIPGYTYCIEEGRLVREDRPFDLGNLEEMFKGLPPEHMQSIKEWFPLFLTPVPEYRRVALDIEVATEAVDRIPDPSVAKNQVICASLVASDGLNRVLLLKRSGTEEGLRPPDLPGNVELSYFDDELSLIKEIFKYLLDYPIVLTFNGDNFDLHYLWRRAQVLGMKKEEIPILMGREIALLPTGIHIDLYKFLHNHAIQVYAFGNSYREVTLDSVASALLDIKKIPIEKTVTELDYLQLASYCYRDALIVLRLSSENSSLIMNLITMIMRISRMSMEDVTRQGISRWIRSLFFYEHRARNYLIPRQSDIEAMKGEASTTAIIKGKKYLGAIVIKPESNVYFDVVVLDFASLYPSIISRWNLSYETVRCVHESCKSNLVPDTRHWVCTKRVGLMSLIIGILKDVRVKWFKQKSKDPSLSPEERNWYKVVQQALKVFLNACFTGDTDILTTEGVKNVKDVKVGDRVINVNPETLEPEVDEVVETQEFDYDGYLIHFENDRFTDLIVTPEHRFLVKDRKGAARFVDAEAIYNSRGLIVPSLINPSRQPSRHFSFLEFGKEEKLGLAVKLPAAKAEDLEKEHAQLKSFLKNLNGCCEIDPNGFFIPQIDQISEETLDTIIGFGGTPYLAKSSPNPTLEKTELLPVRVDHELFAKLCGWVVSKGHLKLNGGRIDSSDEGHDGLYIRITSFGGKGRANPEIHRDQVEDALKQIGINYSIGMRGLKISNELFCRWVSKNCYTGEKCERCGDAYCSHMKKIPDAIMDAGESTIKSFLEGLCAGNLARKPSIYSAQSAKLTNQLLVLLARLGHSSKRIYDRGRGVFRVSWRNTNQYTDHWRKTKIPYKGKVYCVTTKKNHTVFAGRNGKLIPCGQSYGVFGAEIFPLYCLPLADSTTAIGRHIIRETINKAKELGVSVIYADTDSLFLYKPTKDQISQIQEWAESKFGIDLEVDKRYTFVTFSGRKKNYLGVMDTGVVDIKGLMGKKRNTPVFIKLAFNEMTQVLKDVKSPQDFDRAKTKIKEIVQNCYANLKSRRYTLDELAFRVMLSRPVERYQKTTPQHVKAAKQLKEKGKEVKPGDIISYVKVQGPIGVKPVQLARVDEVDVDKYVGHIETTFGQVLDALGIEFDEIVGIKKLEFFTR
jgi:DNA polymerase elongation subunit (family B)